MSAIKSGGIVITNAGMVGKNDRNRDPIKRTLARPSFETKNRIDSLDKDLGTYQPSASRSIWLCYNFPAKELFVTHMIPVIGIAQFPLKSGRIMLLELSRNPRQHLHSLSLSGLLLLFLGRHLSKIELLLHPIKNVQSGFERHLTKFIELQAPFLFPLVVAGVAIIFQELLGS